MEDSEGCYFEACLSDKLPVDEAVQAAGQQAPRVLASSSAYFPVAFKEERVVAPGTQDLSAAFVACSYSRFIR